MKILTWNINGIRSVKTYLKELFERFDADVICIQETKVTRDQLDEQIAILDGYSSYFSFCRSRSGYSGVATFVRDTSTPVQAEEGLAGVYTPLDDDTIVGSSAHLSDFTTDELQALDKEGRVVITQHKIITDSGDQSKFALINVYCPRAELDNTERLDYKLKFNKLLELRAKELLTPDRHVILCGDLNISHRPIDHCDPVSLSEFERNPGRIWLSDFLLNTEKSQGSNEVHQFIDTFRYFHPAERDAFTCWRTTTGARSTNYGTRIDYIIADCELTRTAFTDCEIWPDVAGSDHCPVVATLNIACIPANRCPSLCTKHMPEYVARQRKLSSFLTPVDKNGHIASDNQHRLTRGHDKRKRCNTKVDGAPITKLATVKTKQTALVSFFTDSGDKRSTLSECANCSSQLHEASTAFPTVAAGAGYTHESPTNKGTVSDAWKGLLKGPPKAPCCRGHLETCVLRTVKKDGPTKGRQFWVCSRPEGHKSNPQARCEHFVWLKK